MRQHTTNISFSIITIIILIIKMKGKEYAYVLCAAHNEQTI